MIDIPTPPESMTRDQLLAYLYTLRENILYIAGENEKLAAKIDKLEEE